MKLTRRLFTIHSWLGLITGIFLILLGLSGSVLVFRHELDRLANHDLLTVKPSRPLYERSLTRCYQTITARYPNLDGIAWMNPNAGPTDAYDFRLYLNDARLFTYDLGLISLNPYTNTILREGKSSDFSPSFIEWLLQFHFSFQLGVPGAALAALFGLTMLGSLLTGVVVYRKIIWKVLCFRVRINRKNWRTLSSDLHRVVGVWSLLLNAIIFFTGFWMNLFAFEAKTWKTEQIPTHLNTTMVLSADALLQKARQLMPDLKPSYVYLPTQPERKFRVNGPLEGQWALWGTGNLVSLDQQTGKLIQLRRLAALPIGDRLEATFFPLHVGNYGGLPVKVLYALIGLTPGLLAITGFLLWWRRVRKAVPNASRKYVLVKST
ncbi:PepSY-associated TM helix domain-containing protein [Spirosoma oryzicola]|uniref:PepSY-associated TM helix domain-containing protein n=1 Tax=Spirosoma oryzicola TaxID=2898794 RepID=UPI001E33ADA9|nr:PepSY-associated TM helix domain-containing protein [Spirosoma oryzicola]UHG94318.1 PepSY domain-containing protein [Spirosoma oryzicola]